MDKRGVGNLDDLCWWERSLKFQRLGWIDCSHCDRVWALQSWPRKPSIKTKRRHG